MLTRKSSSISLHSLEIELDQAPSQMTLQLVLPNQYGSSQRVHEDPHGFDTLQGVHRRSRPVSRNGSFHDSKSPGFVNTRLVNYNRQLSHQPSLRSQRPEPPVHIPPPSSEEEKSKMTRRYFATIISMCYAIFLVMFGLIVFIGDAVVDQRPIPQIFCLYMLVVGIIYFLFLYIDIRLHIGKARKAVNERDDQMRRYEDQMHHIEEHFQSSLEMRQTANGNVVQIPIPDIVMNPVKPISHRYCFATGRHGEFFYLKLGAAWFCFGLLIHSTLSIFYESVYLSQDSECFDALQLTVDILFPIYSILLLFFIFKYCNVIINEYRGAARICIMHAIGTSLAFWIFTIVRETVNAIELKRESKKNYMDAFVDGHTITSNSSMYAYYADDECPGSTDLNSIRRMFSPYLYPFVIEFCILIVGIFYMMWANINQCPKKKAEAHAHGHGHGHGHGGSAHGSHNDLHNSTTKLVHNHSFNNLHPIHEEDHSPNGLTMPHRPGSSVSDHHNPLIYHESSDYKSSLVIYADCHAASRGLFAGMILMILKIVFIILLHVAVHNPDYADTGVIIDRSFELLVLFIMIVTVVCAYVQTSKLDINPHPISKLDDVLLFIAIPAFFSETIFSMVPAIVYGSYLNVAIIMAQLIQILLQTSWIIDALRRCTNSEELKREKPGRELVTFLTIANVALWIYYTFSVKTGDIQDERYKFYSDEIWSILNHLSLPLIMFYRFHASVCLVDIWRHSYEPGEFAH
ncbi:proton channel OtopLc-like isoform X2 [Chironomus tepperi]|uniref:proton channel OtopLc-like isoform X2 n=1 Tax=Chironomus tepperi TaxID=113505 RepID=UPI00391F5463